LLPKYDSPRSAYPASGPAQRLLAAPAHAPATEQQDAEHDPRDDREHHLVDEVLREQVLDEEGGR